jgi:hypothetical protein
MRVKGLCAQNFSPAFSFERNTVFSADSVDGPIDFFEILRQAQHVRSAVFCAEEARAIDLCAALIESCKSAEKYNSH